MLVQPSKLPKQLPNSAELRAQPLSGAHTTNSPCSQGDHATQWCVRNPCGACAMKCAAQAPFQRHLVLRAQHASQNPIPMLFKHPKLIPTLSFHPFSTSITQIHSHSLIFIASKGKALAKASSTRVHGSTSQQQPPLEIQLYETLAHEKRGKILEERKALHERTNKFPKGILARGWGFMYEPSIPINLSWVLEFYANKTKKDQREIFLRGRKITCSVSTIEKTLGIPKFKGKYGYSEIFEAYNNKTLNMDEVL
ncbi:hypothetical protein PIB30_065077 [Stylosanthes scabra]|uniref:Uncharacterized protein n=1 Tax=Stylosanthes scabra TaxID=79078 RepID=A0ABU6ZKK3_9FABA|nr:hypothetical protein [Stylosanthes scabra]